MKDRKAISNATQKAINNKGYKMPVKVLPKNFNHIKPNELYPGQHFLPEEFDDKDDFLIALYYRMTLALQI